MKIKALDQKGKEKGKLLKAAFEVFQNKYEHSKGSEIKVLDYPKHDISNTTLLSTIRTESFLTIIVVEFYTTHAPFDVQILEKPRKTVFVTKGVGKKQLTIPVFGKVGSVHKDNGLPDRTIEIKGVGTNDDRLFYVKLQAFQDDGDNVALTPFNYVQSTKNAEEVTAEVTWVSFGGSKQIPKGALPKVKLPALQNICAMKPDDELMKLHSVGVETTSKRDVLVIDCGVSSKKQKVAPA